MNRVYLLICAVLVLNTAVFASTDHTIDSLTKVIPQLSGCERQTAIGRLAQKFNGSEDFDTCSILIAPLMGGQACDQANLYYYRYKADSFFINFEFDAAISWNNKALHLADTLKNKEYRIRALLALGHITSLIGRFDEAVEFYPEVLAHYLGDEVFSVYEFAAKLYLNALQSKGLYAQLEKEALQMSYEAMARNSYSFVAICNYYLAASSFETNLYQRAKSYNRLAMSAVNKQKSAADVYTSLGIHALNQKLYQRENLIDSVKYSLKQIDSLIVNLDYRQKAWHLTNWAEFYNDQGEYKSALLIADSLFKDERIKTDGAISYYFMLKSKATALFELDQFEQAIAALRPAIQFYKEQENFDELRHSYALMAKAQYHSLKPDSGDYYQNQYVIIRDSVYSADMQAELAEQQIKFETRQKEAKLAAQDQLLLEQAETAEQQKLTITIIVIALAMLMGLVFGVYRSRQKLAVSNKLVEKRSAELLDKNEENELLLKEIHHRVKNNLQVIMSLLDLQAMRLDESASKDALLSSQARIKSMALIHEELYQQDRFSVIKFDAYLDVLIAHISAVFDVEKTAHISKRIVNAEIDIDTAIPLALIVNEVITNAFKYGKRKDGTLQVSLNATLTNGWLTLEIRDYGLGMPDLDQLNNGTSLGLRIVKRLAKQIAASYTLEGSDEGTSFKIKTPIEQPQSLNNGQ